MEITPFNSNNNSPEGSPVHSPAKVLPVLSPSFYLKYGNIITKMKELAFTKRLKRLRSQSKPSSTTLDLHVFQLFENFCVALKENKSLEDLNLSGVSMSALMFSRLMQALSQHIKLKSLNFGLTDLSNLSLKYICRTLKENPNIYKLNLFHVSILRENLRDLTELLTYNKSLEEINLNFCDMGNESVKDYCEGLVKARNIVKIKLAKNGFEKNSWKALGFFLAKVKYQRKIKKLDLSYNNISSPELSILGGYLNKIDLCRRNIRTNKSCDFIENLKLNSNKIRGKEAIEQLNEIIIGLGKMQKLGLAKNHLENQDLIDLGPSFERIHKKIDLSRNNFDDEISENLDFFRNLKFLDVSHNKLGRRACEKLSAFLKKSQNIEILDISDNNIGSSGFERLCEALNENKTLKILKVNRTEIEKIKKFRDLRENFSIKSLEISGNPLNLEALGCFFNEEKPNLLETLVLDGINFMEIIRSTKKSFSNKRNNSSKNQLNSPKESNNNNENTCNEDFDPLNANIRSPLIKLVSAQIFDKNLQKSLDFSNLQSISLKNSAFFASPMLKALKNNQKALILKLNISQCSSLTNKDYRNLSIVIEKLSNLQHLCLNNLSLGSLAPIYLEPLLKSLANAQKLKILELNNNSLRDFFPEFLINLQKTPELSEVYLRNNYFPNDSYETLGIFLTKASNLTHLDLSDNSLGYLTISNLCETLRSSGKKLINLYLRNTSLNITCLYPISQLMSQNISIKVLDLSLNDFMQKDFNAMIFQEKIGGIKEMDLTNYNLDDYQAKNLVKFLAKPSNLISFKIKDTKFKPWDLIRILKYLAEVSSLKNLEITNIPLQDQEISEFLRRIRRNKGNLKSLSFQILDDFKEKSCESLAKYLSETQALESLEIIEVGDLMIGFEGIIKGIIGKTEFSKLVLNKVGLDKKGIIGLCEILNNKEIKELILEDNRLDMGDFEEILQRLRLEGGTLNILSLNNNNLIRNNWTMGLFGDLEITRIQDLRLSKSLNNINVESLRSFVKGLSKNQFLRSLELNDNGFSDENLLTLSELFKESTKLKSFSIKSNKFTSLGLDALFKSLYTNKTLEYLDISNNLTSKDELFFCEFLTNLFSHNTSIKLLDLSNIGLLSQYNKTLTSILTLNTQIFFINTHWKGIRSPLALKILERLFCVYVDYRGNNLSLPNSLKSLDFSNSRLDDEFCVNFAELLGFGYLTELETMDISRNPKITLIGLKFIYVGLANLGKIQKNHIQKVYFEACNHSNLLNDGLAAALVDWARYKETSNRFYQSFFNSMDWFFSKMVIRANRFSYGSDFEDFQEKFPLKMILWLFAGDFILVNLLSIFLPTILTLAGHNYYSFAVFFVYTVFSVALELTFWLQSKKFLNKVAIIEKDWQREIFINDILNLISGGLARYDLYSDMIFVIMTLCYGFWKIFYGSVAVMVLKYLFKLSEFCQCYYKLIMAVRHNKSSLRIWNLIAKLAVVMDFTLAGDILDRYCPGNSKKVKRICFFKIGEPKYISMGFLAIAVKFFLEDIPQTVIQLIFFVTKGNVTKENQIHHDEVSYFCHIKGLSNDSSTMLVDFWLSLNITRLIICFFVSFYGLASIRQSYIEQSDFDERIETQKLLEGDNYKKKSVMKQRINSIRSNSENNKKIQDRMTVITSKYLANIIKKSKTIPNNKPLNRGDEGIEDFVNLAVNSVESKEIERNEGGDIEFMNSRVRLKKYFDPEDV